MREISVADLIELVRGHARLVALIVIIVALVVVNFVFYSGSHSSAAQQTTVERQLVNAKLNLANAESNYNLTTLQAEQASLTGTPSFPASFPGVDLSNRITTGASNYGIGVISLTPKGAVGTVMVGGTNYVEYDTVVSIAPIIAGDYMAMDSFVSYLEDLSSQEPQLFLSLSITGASFNAQGGTFTVVILAQS